MRGAQKLNDLVVKADGRQVLWRSLRERALISGQYAPADLPELDLDPALLALLGDWQSVADASKKAA